MNVYQFIHVSTVALFILLAIPTLISLLKGAPFLPTPFKRAEKMLRLAKIKKGERVYDLGCGDGRFVYLAAKEYGARATGLEYSPLVFLWARIRKLFWRSKAEIRFANFWTTDISDADVVVCYMLPGVVEKMADKIARECKPGTRVLSYAFQIKQWQEVHKEEKVPDRNFSPIWVYEVA